MKMTCGLFLLCALLAGCRSSAKTTTPGEAATVRAVASVPARPLPVEVFEIKAKAEAGAQSIPAVISAEATAVMLAKRDGVITWLAGQEGARVKAGEVLARFEDDETKTQLRQAELEVARLQFEERQYEATIKVNQSELGRTQTLARDGLVSQTDIERAQYKVEVAQQELEKTRLATRMAQTRVEAAQLETAKTVMRAPLTGIVTQRWAKLGSNVVRNDKLFEIAQLAPLEVRFQLPQSDGWQPRTGEVIRLSLSAEAPAIASARIHLVAPIADAASNARGYAARLLSTHSLIPGTAVFVQRPRLAPNDGWWIPRAAFPPDVELQRDSSGVILVLGEGKCAARTVWIKTVESDQVEIGSGLATADRVILAPAAGLKPGDAVTVASQ